MTADWYVIRTGVRCEDKAAKSLRALGYRVYVPKMRKSVKHHRTKKWETRYFSLMVRYIFIAGRGKPIEWLFVDDCDGVTGKLGVNGTPTAIPSGAVANLMQLQRSRKFDDLHVERETNKQKRAVAKARFRRGQAIHVMNGPFSGFAAHVTDITARGAIAAMLEIFGRMTPVEFELDDVKGIDVENAA